MKINIHSMQVKKKNSIVLFIFCITCLALPAQRLSLDSILHTVASENPVFDAWEARINAWNELAKGARALDPPQAGAGFFMTPYNPSMWKSDEAAGNPGMGSFMVSGQQMFINKKKRDANADYMNNMSSVDSAMKEDMKNEMLAMAKMNYYELLILHKKLLILNESEQLIEYLIKATELKYTYGMEKLNAYYKAKAMLGEIQAMKVMVLQETGQKKIQLNTLMNRKKDQPVETDTLFEIKNYEKTTTDSSLIASSRSGYKAISSEIRLLGSKQKYQSSQKYPDYGIRYDHMFPFGTQPQQFSLMFMISFPFASWSKSMYTANVASLNYEITEKKEIQRQYINEVSGKIEFIKVQIAGKKKQIELTEEIILPSMKKNYETELLAYEQNTEMLFMVLDAWQNLKTTQLTYLDQLMQLLLLQVEYEKELEIR
ncbi:MAG: TolC family protein [Bacteroidota bacterium]